MSTHTQMSRARRIARRVSAVWSDLDYAQRRLLEIQTGTTGLTRQHDPKTRAHEPELESDL